LWQLRGGPERGRGVGPPVPQGRRSVWRRHSTGGPLPPGAPGRRYPGHGWPARRHRR